MSITHYAYRLRGFLIPLPIIFSLFCFSFEIEVDYFIWPIGVSIFLFGILLRIWAQQHLHYRLKVKKYLTTTGPYSFVRNPIYLGNILICLGLIIISELLWLVPITFFYCFGIYSLAIRYEERHLLEKFGETYLKYVESVPRWFPKGFNFKNLGFVNNYFLQSILVEFPCLFLLLPYIIKEVVD
ncbi:MAG: methyltransferase family protein [Thermodesulfobacteriota bacterium]